MTCPACARDGAKLTPMGLYRCVHCGSKFGPPALPEMPMKAATKGQEGGGPTTGAREGAHFIRPRRGSKYDRGFVMVADILSAVEAGAGYKEIEHALGVSTSTIDRVVKKKRMGHYEGLSV